MTPPSPPAFGRLQSDQLTTAAPGGCSGDEPTVCHAIAAQRAPNRIASDKCQCQRERPADRTVRQGGKRPSERSERRQQHEGLPRLPRGEYDEKRDGDSQCADRGLSERPVAGDQGACSNREIGKARYRAFKD